MEEQDIARRASLVATIPEVRRAMVAQQRAMAAEGNIVMVGRDIGTVVAPEADLKVFITGSVRERARRRWRDLLREDRELDFEQVLQDTRAPGPPGQHPGRTLPCWPPGTPLLSRRIT